MEGIVGMWGPHLVRVDAQRSTCPSRSLVGAYLRSVSLRPAPVPRDCPHLGVDVFKDVLDTELDP